MKPYLVQSFNSIEGTGRAGWTYNVIKEALKEKGVIVIPDAENYAGSEYRILFPSEGFEKDLDRALLGFMAAVVDVAKPPKFSWAKFPEIEWNEDGYRIRAKVKV
jgi:hypothetical protein